ncbi:glycosyltransferase [Ensifer adhaerens]|uniref:glycosyltransferase family 2 protein n=1 Tax=Ensifer adhaerens TaxID=106592 RepID=UPI001CBC062E|nr:glycosyltransferase [Ensifer adhaerens]MBZ7923316.1 glycosyltransferase [Ensifer adhaerens]UAX91890.1 glycosyltransferase [Ensifer adhaerens]UAX99518.1 glycosyltransferase [Ensifer adhaerens]UAY06901.1 glycosyltransferase [Ensifer adhaerens]
MKIVVGIATAGRREILSQTLLHLTRQDRRPDAIFVCPSASDDVDEAFARTLPVPVTIVAGERGLTKQRNAILASIGTSDLLVFFDDDFLPRSDFLAQAEKLFRSEPDIVVATGLVLADGIHGPGISVADGLEILRRDGGTTAGSPPTPVYNAYGCNMVFRFGAVQADGTRFDERLPLYGWQEDVDFCRRLSQRGRIVKSDALRGVHLGNKRGRTSGLRFGYSQVANPLYLFRKGTVSLKWALRLMGGNIAANLAGSLKPQGLVDRRGRLKGNVIAFLDLLRGRMDPLRMLEL